MATEPQVWIGDGRYLQTSFLPRNSGRQMPQACLAGRPNLLPQLGTQYRTRKAK